MRGLRRTILMVVAVGCALCGFTASAQAAGQTFTWSAPVQVIPPSALSKHGGADGLDLTCPSVSFCAISHGGSVWTSFAPSVPAAWEQEKLLVKGSVNEIEQLACPAVDACFAAAQGVVLASGEPGAGVPAWKKYSLGGGDWFNASCSSGLVCSVFNILRPRMSVSRDPLGGPATWESATVPVKRDNCEFSNGRGPCASQLDWTDCASVSVCLAVDGYGQLLITDHFGRAAHWSKLQVGPPSKNDQDNLVGGTCPSARFCAFGDDERFVASTAPGTTHWHVSGLPFDALNYTPDHLACAGAALCMSVNGGGALAWTTDPAAIHPTWHGQTVDTAPVSNPKADTGLPYSVACPSTIECFLLDPDGRLLVGRLS